MATPRAKLLDMLTVSGVEPYFIEWREDYTPQKVTEKIDEHPNAKVVVVVKDYQQGACCTRYALEHTKLDPNSVDVKEPVSEGSEQVRRVVWHLSNDDRRSLLFVVPGDDAHNRGISATVVFDTTWE
jgi:hypothetical protein